MFLVSHESDNSTVEATSAGGPKHALLRCWRHYEILNPSRQQFAGRLIGLWGQIKQPRRLRVNFRQDDSPPTIQWTIPRWERSPGFPLITLKYKHSNVLGSLQLDSMRHLPFPGAGLVSRGSTVPARRRCCRLFRCASWAVEVLNWVWLLC